MRVLFFIADAFYVLIYYILGYRKKIVMDNLLIAFPEKTEKEREQIARKFYHNLIDSFIETIKMFSASDKFLLKHCTGNWDFLNELHATGQSCEILVGHTFNWEWANYAFARKVRYKFLGVYMPVNNKALNRVFLKLRARSGTVLLPATDMKNSMIPHRGTQYALGLASDQSPSNHPNAYWIPFFGRITGFISGPEKGARTGDMPVIFALIEKKRRGYYNVVFSMGEAHSGNTQVGDITRKYARFMEETIKRMPDMWLWSHRRWKHAWKSEYPYTFPVWPANHPD